LAQGLAVSSPMSGSRLAVPPRWARALLILASVRHAAAFEAPRFSPDHWPLSTDGRYIVRRGGERQKWACVNWGNAHGITHVVAGLERQKLMNITQRIASMGFNCVRLPYSTEGHLSNPLIDDEHLAANPDLQGKRFLEVFDATVAAISEAGLMVIINNHNHVSGWCCSADSPEGLWYVPGYNESVWIDSLTSLAKRYINNHMVVAFDVRNEPHDYKKLQISWGDRNRDTDIAWAQERAGNAVLGVNKDLLIVIAAPCFSADLRGIRDYQVQLSQPNKVVYEVHNYRFFQVWETILPKFLSWTEVGWYSYVLYFLTALLAVTVATAWYLVGAPQPPPGLLMITVGMWVLIPTILVTLVIKIAIRFVWHLCYVRSLWHDILPGTWVALLLGAVGIILITGGLVFMLCDDDDKQEKATRGVPLGEPLEKQTLVPNPSSPWQGVPASSKYRSFAIAHGAAKKMCKVPKEESAAWDHGVSCWLNVFLLSLILSGFFVALHVWGHHVANSYELMSTHQDRRFGFVLDEGYEWTAPVWVGEFGSYRRGVYWMNFLRYLAERDVDWAYWPLQGTKFMDGVWSPDGYTAYENPHYEDDTFGIFKNDSYTIREPWRLTDLKGLMTSPAVWRPSNYPCNHEALGPLCGG